MFASSALCHFRKTRTQCLSGRTENNHGTLVGIVGFRAGMKHKTFRICCTLHHSMATCPPHTSNHLHNKIPYDCRRPVRKLRIPPQTYSYCSASSFNSSPPSAATVHRFTSRAAWVLRCLGRHEGSSEREGFGCGQFQNITQEAPHFCTQCRQTGCIWRVLGFHSAFWLLTFSVTKVVDPWLGIPFGPQNLNLKHIYCANAWIPCKSELFRHAGWKMLNTQKYLV